MAKRFTSTQGFKIIRQRRKQVLDRKGGEVGRDVTPMAKNEKSQSNRQRKLIKNKTL